MKILSNGAWNTQNGNKHVYDAGLSTAIVDYAKRFECKLVYDFGCGMGSYAKALKESGFSVLAVDGNPHTPELTNGIGLVQDLSVPFLYPRVADLVLCLEVGEHIPAKFESVLLDNITKHSSNVVILSWAVPKQDGEGHVNCRPNQYIMDEMAKRGFSWHVKHSNEMRQSVTNAYWFKNTLMVFHRKTT